MYCPLLLVHWNTGKVYNSAFKCYSISLMINQLGTSKILSFSDFSFTLFPHFLTKKNKINQFLTLSFFFLFFMINFIRFKSNHTQIYIKKEKMEMIHTHTMCENPCKHSFVLIVFIYLNRTKTCCFSLSIFLCKKKL